MNEIYEVIGIEYRNYISKKTGKRVEGYNVYMTYPGPTGDAMQGLRCLSHWVSVDTMQKSKIAVGDCVYIFYNRFGMIEAIGKTA